MTKALGDIILYFYSLIVFSSRCNRGHDDLKFHTVLVCTRILPTLIRYTMIHYQFP